VREAATTRIRATEQATLQLAQGAVPAEAAGILVVLHLELLLAEALGRGEAPGAGHLLGWDLLARLGAARAARATGLVPEQMVRALGLDQRPREPDKDAPGALLLARAGIPEVSW
jgi:hypothetical protein